MAVVGPNCMHGIQIYGLLLLVYLSEHIVIYFVCVCICLDITKGCAKTANPSRFGMCTLVGIRNHVSGEVPNPLVNSIPLDMLKLCCNLRARYADYWLPVQTRCDLYTSFGFLPVENVLCSVYRQTQPIMLGVAKPPISGQG